MVPCAKGVSFGEDVGKQAKSLLIAQRSSNASKGMALLGRAQCLAGRFCSKSLRPKGVCGQKA